MQFVERRKLGKIYRAKPTTGKERVMYGKAGGGAGAAGAGTLAYTGFNSLWLAVAAFTLIGAGFSMVFLVQPAFAGARQWVGRQIFRRH